MHGGAVRVVWDATVGGVKVCRRLGSQERVTWRRTA